VRSWKAVYMRGWVAGNGMESNVDIPLRVENWRMRVEVKHSALPHHTYCERSTWVTAQRRKVDTV